MNLAQMLMTGPMISKTPIVDKLHRRNKSQTSQVREQILKVLDHGPTSTKNISRDLGITRPAALNLMNQMRRDGLVVAEVIQDGIVRTALWSKK